MVHAPVTPYALQAGTVLYLVWWSVNNIILNSLTKSADYGRYRKVSILFCRGWECVVGLNSLWVMPVPVPVLRGARVIRTYDGPKNPHISLFLHTILGRDYYFEACTPAIVVPYQQQHSSCVPFLSSFALFTRFSLFFTCFSNCRYRYMFSGIAVRRFFCALPSASQVIRAKVSHVLAHLLIAHPLVITLPAIWPGSVHTPLAIMIPLSHTLVITPCNLAGVCSHSIAITDTVITPHRYHTPCNLAAAISTIIAVSTPPRYRTTSLPHPLAAGFLCMVFITGDALKYHTHNSTPGDTILKREKC